MKVEVNINSGTKPGRIILTRHVSLHHFQINAQETSAVINSFVKIDANYASVFTDHFKAAYTGIVLSPFNRKSICYNNKQESR